MNWKPHTEHPDSAPQSTLIAVTDEEGIYFLLSDLYIWNGATFRSEETGKPFNAEKFWWIPESEVLEGLPE